MTGRTSASTSAQPVADQARHRHRVRSAIRAQRRQHASLDHLSRAVERYRDQRVEYHALVVVSRGLFLTISVVLVLLYALRIITRQMPGANEIVIPTAAAASGVDIGASVDQVLQQFQGAVLGLVGTATLVVSAAMTARALRTGTRAVLAPESAAKVSRFAPSNLVIGLGLASTILLAWLLALSTAIRTAALSALLGSQVTRGLVPVGKSLTILAAFALLTAVVFRSLRAVDRRRPARTLLAASSVFAAFLVGANFFLLYSYLGALMDPHTSGGVVLVLTILTWANVVARALFLMQCWVAEAHA
ncbi:MAG: hypothetical protein QG597_2410 [Actinomycetota bacterium]|nr:hypothetical protein [Actinomycetota bacterium]